MFTTGRRRGSDFAGAAAVAVSLSLMSTNLALVGLSIQSTQSVVIAGDQGDRRPKSLLWCGIVGVAGAAGGQSAASRRKICADDDAAAADIRGVRSRDVAGGVAAACCLACL